MLDASGTTIAVNAALVRLAARDPRSELRLGANYLAICHDRGGSGDHDRAQIACRLREMLAGDRDGFAARYVLDSAAQPPRWYGVRATLFRGDGPGQIVMQHYDSTVFVEAQDVARLRTRLLDEIDAAVIAGGLDGAITLWSRGAERVFGWTADEVVGRDATEVVVAADHREVAKAGLEELKRTGARVTERELQRKDGSRFVGYASSAVYHDEEGLASGLISVILDATERVRAAQELNQARDHLRAVTDSMGEALCTLDDVGHVSYTNAAAERLLGWSADEMGGRMLHDLVHAHGCDVSSSRRERCPLARGRYAREAVRVEDDAFLRRDGSTLAVSWVLTPFDSPSGNHSVIVFTDNTRTKAAQRRLQLEITQLSQVRTLHEALQQQRFVLFAQPIIDLATGAVVAHELLLRIRDRDGGILEPRSFLPVAEHCGLSGELDRWVIRQAAALVGEGHRVTLNLSAASLGDPGLFDDFAAAFAEHGADPALVVIELTETALTQDEVVAGTFIDRVEALGCQLALDDFGTGFGGFGYLKRLPVQYLKIDIEFVRDLRTNVASRHVVRAVVGLAAAFGHRTVAEGVEDELTLDLIRAMGVDFAQGFAIGRPAPLAQTLYRAA